MAATQSQGLNGANSGMYPLKPYYNASDPVKLPDCMYKMSNIHKSGADCDGKVGTVIILDPNRNDAIPVIYICSLDDYCPYQGA